MNVSTDSLSITAGSPRVASTAAVPAPAPAAAPIAAPCPPPAIAPTMAPIPLPAAIFSASFFFVAGASLTKVLVAMSMERASVVIRVSCTPRCARVTGVQTCALPI